ncbi:MAG: peptidase carboxypeptidase [Acidobacteria bacterium]|nr:peptidase carboxypeptidase [Acidobacteriota bacterium]
MPTRISKRLPAVVLAALMALSGMGLYAQGTITPPKFGQYTAGDDYFLANYTQLVEYWGKLSKESNRMKVVEIGKTSEGRTMIMAIITSPANHQKLDRYKEISQRLARAEGLTDDQARALASEGKAVIWIDGGLHATECVPAQGLFEMSYQMVSRNDPETLRILNDVILLLTPVNPDGMELVSNWYMKEPEPTRRSTGGIPVLYNKYAGHDNNRDSYMSNLSETEAINRQMFIEWIPQIMYNQHQTGPAGSVLFMAPFRDPFNYNYDPLVPMGIELVGMAIHNRFIAEGKPGAVTRGAANYSTWFNGGVRTSVGFHNQIGLLSECIGNPTPVNIPLVPARFVPDGNQPYPIMPQVWHQRQSIEYLITANRAILDLASKMREDFLYRIYRMGKNSIERGSRDTWTITPKKLKAFQDVMAKDQQAAAQAAGRGAMPGGAGGMGARGGGEGFGGGGGGRGGGSADAAKYMSVLHNPATRDPRGFILPSDQPDFLTTTRFINVLMRNGVVAHRATSSFQVAGKTYPAGSYVLKAAQAFRPQLMDMMEPQDHPDDIPYPGGPPRAPYDVTGWTVAYQMGVQFDRIMDAFDGPFEKLTETVKVPAGKITAAQGTAGYLLSHQLNDSFVGTTRLLAAGEEVYWLKNPFSSGGKAFPAGTIYIPSKPTTRAVLDKLAAEIGLSFDATATAPAADALKLRTLRVGLWDTYGGSMPSGWIRYMFEKQYPIPYQLVFAPELDAGNLASKFDVIILPNGAGISGAGGRGGGGGGGRGGGPANVPPEYQNRVGSMTAATTLPQLRRFLEDGGTIVAIGSATGISEQLGLPLGNHLSERLADGTERGLSREKYYVPGSIVQVTVDTSNPLAYGLPEKLDVFYSNNPVFRFEPDAALKGLKPVAWFATEQPLRSGWAWGQAYLKGGLAAVEAPVGKGKVYLFGPEITFRAQPHGAFKFLFNGMYLAGATPVRLGPAGRSNN